MTRSALRQNTDLECHFETVIVPKLQLNWTFITVINKYAYTWLYMYTISMYNMSARKQPGMWTYLYAKSITWGTGFV